MACGVPVISTRCPSGPDEIITDGVDGLLVPVGDVKAMAEAILKLLRDEPLRKRLAEAGKKRANDFRVEKMVLEYERTLNELF
jgi:glycosyltransferase involved in cell wall biosynthesis